jgi:hypothetical protein
MKKLDSLLLVLLFSGSSTVGYSQTTYLGYPGRPAPVDYNQISRNAIGMVENTQRDRENRKAELDRVTADNISFVSSKTSTSVHSSVNYLHLVLQQVIVTELQNYNYLLKQGQIDPAQFTSINTNCTSQFNNALNYCNQLDAKLNLIDKNSDAYRKSESDMLNYIESCIINFNTVYQETRKYKMVLSQSYLIKTDSDGQLSLDWFIYNVKKYIGS